MPLARMRTWSTRGDLYKMIKPRPSATCDDCYFRREGLCALAGNTPCPTFRAAAMGALTPPRQPQLVPRPVPRIAVGHAA
jgi:hypothetical protein